MSNDPTEAARRLLLEAGIPEQDCAAADKRWTTAELTEEFEVIGFMAPFCVVKRRSDGVKGSMEFTHSPRFYFNFKPDRA